MHDVARRPGGILQAGSWRRDGRGRRLWHPTIGRGELVAPDGTVLWAGEWEENTLHDAGEGSMLNVYLREQANPSKYLGLAAQGSVASIAETAVMTGITEAETPGTDGYARQQILAADWSAPALDSGDMMSTAAQKSFGPNGGTTWSVSHTFLTTAATGTAGLLILTVPLSAVQAVENGIAFRHTLSWKQQ